MKEIEDNAGGKIYNVLELEKKILSNYYTIQDNLKIQCNSYQINIGIVSQSKNKNLNLYKVRRTWIAKAVLIKKKKLQESGSVTSDYITKLQSSKQYSTGPLKQKYRSMEQDQKPRSNLLHLCSINL